MIIVTKNYYNRCHTIFILYFSCVEMCSCIRPDVHRYNNILYCVRTESRFIFLNRKMKINYPFHNRSQKKSNAGCIICMCNIIIYFSFYRNTAVHILVYRVHVYTNRGGILCVVCTYINLPATYFWLYNYNIRRKRIF